MNRSDFILRLEQALGGMPEEEGRRAVEYYENYFDEAGPENEADVLRTLGAPEKVAADILREFRDVGGPAAAGQNQEHDPRSGKKRVESYAARAKDRFQSMDNGQKCEFYINHFSFSKRREGSSDKEISYVNMYIKTKGRQTS